MINVLKEGIERVKNEQLEKVDFIVSLNEKKLNNIQLFCSVYEQENSIVVDIVGYDVLNIHKDSNGNEVPMSIARVTIGEQYTNIDKLYVASSYRRKGIGSAIVGILQDLTANLCGENHSLYALKRFSLNDENIQAIRKYYGNNGVFDNILNSVLQKKTNASIKSVANKFFANQGFMVDTRTLYDYPRKHIIEGTGYLFGDDKKSLKATIDNVVYDEAYIIM